jgi:AmmeMemoRadiSam system protein B
MVGPTGGSVRTAAVAGSFYPAAPAECRASANAMLTAAQTANRAGGLGQAAPPVYAGGIVPHAGWICSGVVAAQTIAAIAAGRPTVHVVVVFGAIHLPLPTDRAMLDTFDRWTEPTGDSIAAADLRRKLAELTGSFAADDRFHQREHAVEVELPLLQMAWPRATVLAVQTPPIEAAVEFGRQTARTVKAMGWRAVYLASSDMTHYGPQYRFNPWGGGIPAFARAMENDRHVLQAVTDMRPEAVVPIVRAESSACGAGAIAAMLAACQESGATHARVLRHTNSFETLAGFVDQPSDNSVGYAAVVVG